MPSVPCQSTTVTPLGPHLNALPRSAPAPQPPAHSGLCISPTGCRTGCLYERGRTLKEIVSVGADLFTRPCPPASSVWEKKSFLQFLKEGYANGSSPSLLGAEEAPCLPPAALVSQGVSWVLVLFFWNRDSSRLRPGTQRRSCTFLRCHFPSAQRLHWNAGFVHLHLTLEFTVAFTNKDNVWILGPPLPLSCWPSKFTSLSRVPTNHSASVASLTRSTSSLSLVFLPVNRLVRTPLSWTNVVSIRNLPNMVLFFLHVLSIRLVRFTQGKKEKKVLPLHLNIVSLRYNCWRIFFKQNLLRFY